MLKDLKKIIIGISFIIGIIFLFFIINQFVIFFGLLRAINLYLAYSITALVIGLLIFILLKTSIIWLKSPKVTILPPNPTDSQYQLYLSQTIDMLKCNKHLKDLAISFNISNQAFYKKFRKALFPSSGSNFHGKIY